MLLRNINPAEGLCNGTRLTLLEGKTHCLKVRINGGDFDGKIHVLYRMFHESQESDFPYKLFRLQFPVRLAFAMTINEVQGQSLEHQGIDLHRPVFTHGQLHAAMSRATNVENISVLLDERTTGDKHVMWSTQRFCRKLPCLSPDVCHLLPTLLYPTIVCPITVYL